MKFLISFFLILSIQGCGLDLEEEISEENDSNKNITRKPVQSVSSNGSSCSFDLEVTILGTTSNSTECYESDSMDVNSCTGLKELIEFAFMFYDATVTDTFSEQPCPLANSFGQCNDGRFLTRFYEGSAQEQEDNCEKPVQVKENGEPVENEFEIAKEWLAD